jgi:hypothetical protein
LEVARWDEVVRALEAEFRDLPGNWRAGLAELRRAYDGRWIEVAGVIAAGVLRGDLPNAGDIQRETGSLGGRSTTTLPKCGIALGGSLAAAMVKGRKGTRQRTEDEVFAAMFGGGGPSCGAFRGDRSGDALAKEIGCDLEASGCRCSLG